MHYTTSCNTQSSAPEDEHNNCPKHVELIGIINKPLLLHLVGCLYCLYQGCSVKRISRNIPVSEMRIVEMLLVKTVKVCRRLDKCGREGALIVK